MPFPWCLISEGFGPWTLFPDRSCFSLRHRSSGVFFQKETSKLVILIADVAEKIASLQSKQNPSQSPMCDVGLGVLYICNVSNLMRMLGVNYVVILRVTAFVQVCKCVNHSLPIPGIRVRIFYPAAFAGHKKWQTGSCGQAQWVGW